QKGAEFKDIARQHGVDKEDFKNMFKDLALKLHPDKGGDSDSFAEMKQLYDSLKEGKVETDNFVEKVSSNLSKANIGIKSVDIGLDLWKAYNDNGISREYLHKELFPDIVLLYGMFEGDLKLSIVTTVFRLSTKIYDEDYMGAVGGALVVGGYTMAVAAASTAFPVTVTAVSAVTTLYSAYNVGSKAWDMVSEYLYGQEEITQPQIDIIDDNVFHNTGELNNITISEGFVEVIDVI
ncbi:MAG: hypothetical protein ACI8ZF_000990, partial [Candidatus Midichloriaceae bacterium]